MSNNVPKILAFIVVFFTVTVACFVGFKHLNKIDRQPDVNTYETTNRSTKTEMSDSLAFEESSKAMSITSIDLTKEEPMSTTKENETFITTKATTKKATTTKKNVPYIKYIEITSFPSKTAYYIGDSFSASGLKVKAYYSDNTSKDVSSSVKCSSPNMNSKGTKSVQVEFADSSGNTKTTSFNITVSAPYVSLSKTDLTLFVDDSYYLFAYKEPFSCTTTWHTTSFGIVNVDKYGCVTAMGTGTAAVYASIVYNGITYTSDYCWITVKKEETTEAAMPQSKEEIVTAFNTAVNDVKTDATKVTRKYSKISLNGTPVFPSAIEGLLNLLGGAENFLNDQISKNSKGEETYTGADIDAVYPVENESYASKLTASDVSSANIIEKDGKWIIRVTTVADGKSDNIRRGQGHAPKAFNVVLPGVVNDNIPEVATSIVGLSTINYPASTCTVTVDPATGRAINADYDLKWTINFDKVGVVIPFTTNDYFVISY